MKNEQIETEWLIVTKKFEDHFGKKCKPEALLLFIGLREVGIAARKFSKEEMSDLLHVGNCAVLAKLGYFEFSHVDTDGWPHYSQNKTLPEMNKPETKFFLKKCFIEYLREMWL